MHLITLSEIEACNPSRNSQGGTPYLPERVDIPRCALCQEQMLLFFQFEIKQKFKLPFASGAQLAVFMCPTHNDIPQIPNIEKGQNPESYKLQAPGHYKLYLFSPKESLVAKPLKKQLLTSYSLNFQSSSEEIEDLGDGIQSGIEAFKVGGQPSWINFTNTSKCSCGADMAFVCQLPENYGFQCAADAPSQPDSFSYEQYCLFLGNLVFILACSANCSPTSVLANCDN